MASNFFRTNSVGLRSRGIWLLSLTNPAPGRRSASPICLAHFAPDGVGYRGGFLKWPREAVAVGRGGEDARNGGQAREPKEDGGQA